MANLGLWGRIKRIMEVMGWDEADLRRELALTPQEVWNWKNRNETIGFEKALEIQSKTLFNCEWVMFQRGPERLQPISPEERRVLDTLRELPAKRRQAFLDLLGLS